MYLFIQEDFSLEIRLEVLHFSFDLLLHHCVERDTQFIQLGLQGGQFCSFLQKTGKVRGIYICGSVANQHPVSHRLSAWLALSVENKKTKCQKQLRLV